MGASRKKHRAGRVALAALGVAAAGLAVWVWRTPDDGYVPGGANCF